MKKLNHITIYLLFISVVMSACSSSPKEENRISPEYTKQAAVQTATESLSQPAQENTQASGEIQAETPKLTLDSTSEEIREKMLSSFLNWQTLEVKAVWESNSLNPDDSVAYTVKYEINTWIDQESLRFRTEEQQINTDVLPKLSISDGTIRVSRDAPSVVEGYPNRPPATTVYRVITGNSDEETLKLLRNGETIFSPIGEAYFGAIKSELFSSSYAVQYPGKYEGMEIEFIAGRETLKVFYGDANLWGRSNIEYTLWIDTETGVVLKVWADGTPDHFTESKEITHIVYNVPVDEKKFNTEEALPDLNLTEMESDIVDGNTIYADNLRVEDENVFLDVCYELPSDADWMAFDMMVDGKTQINPNGFLIYMEQAGTFHTNGLRCYMISFPHTLEDETLHFEIGQLFAPAREGEACTSSNLVSQALEEAGTPIEYTCVEDHGMIISEILSKPDTMTEEEAKAKVYELFAQYRNETFPGPWVFEIPLEQE